MDAEVLLAIVMWCAVALSAFVTCRTGRGAE